MTTIDFVMRLSVHMENQAVLQMKRLRALS